MTPMEWLVLTGLVCVAILGAGLFVYSIRQLFNLDKVEDFDERD